MPEQEEPPEASPLDAIESIAREGLRLHSPKSRFSALYVVLALLALVGVAAAAKKLMPGIPPVVDPRTELPELHECPIGVLLPSTKGDGAVPMNAGIQLSGFEAALRRSDLDYTTCDFSYFRYPLGRSSEERNEVPCEEVRDAEALQGEDDILWQIKRWYKCDKRRIFIITMSGAVSKVKPLFEKWVKGLDERDRPVLVATVASAPNLANGDAGVFRYYVRSQDEVDVMSTYIESLRLRRVAVFYVDDAYGKEAYKLFYKRLDELVIKGGNEGYKIPLGKSAEALAARIEKEVRRFSKIGPDKETVVVIVGYGGMIKQIINTIQEVSGDFEGPILAVSTYTESEWRPDLEQPFSDRVHTVGSGHKYFDMDMEGVVYQFAYRTMFRVDKCKEERGVGNFWDCWRRSDDFFRFDPGNQKEFAVVEFTDQGDSHVSLRVIDHCKFIGACEAAED